MSRSASTRPCPIATVRKLRPLVGRVASDSPRTRCLWTLTAPARRSTSSMRSAIASETARTRAEQELRQRPVVRSAGIDVEVDLLEPQVWALAELDRQRSHVEHRVVRHQAVLDGHPAAPQQRDAGVVDRLARPLAGLD